MEGWVVEAENGPDARFGSGAGGRDSKAIAAAEATAPSEGWGGGNMEMRERGERGVVGGVVFSGVFGGVVKLRRRRVRRRRLLRRRIKWICVDENK